MVRHAQRQPEQADHGADQPLGLAVGRQNMTLSVRAVRMASAEYQGCPPRVVRGSAAHASMAASLNQTVKLPRCRKLASYADQFVTLCLCLGMRWRRSWFSLKGKARIRGQQGNAAPYATWRTIINRQIDPCTICGRPLLGKGKLQDCHDA